MMVAHKILVTALSQKWSFPLRLRAGLGYAGLRTLDLELDSGLSLRVVVRKCIFEFPTHSGSAVLT